MACEGCKHPMHEQYKNYPGHWYCFCPGPIIGRKICDTPVEEYGDIAANNKRLVEARTPKFCPGLIPMANH